MKCWCDDVGYECFECKKENIWNGLTRIERIKLKAYKSIIESDNFDARNLAHKSLQKYILDKNLDIASVPCS